MHKRLFLAITLPEALQHELACYCKALQLSAVRCVPSQNLHITTHFLGSVQDFFITELDGICSRFILAHSIFTLVFKQFSYAPPQDPRRMLWAEFYNNDLYQKFVDGLGQELMLWAKDRDVQFVFNDKTTIPHVTLARFEKDFVPPDGRLPQPPIQDLVVSSVTLFESQLDSAGPVYTPIKTYRF